MIVDWAYVIKMSGLWNKMQMSLKMSKVLDIMFTALVFAEHKR